LGFALILTPWSRLSFGFATGTLTTSTCVSGPRLALWLDSRGLSPRDLRDSLSALFLGIGAIGALTLLPPLPQARSAPLAILVAAAAVVAGHAIGSRIFARITSPRWHRAMFAIILATGITSLALGLRAS
jgi:uncharacterized membrane protein YfcA